MSSIFCLFWIKRLFTTRYQRWFDVSMTSPFLSLDFSLAMKQNYTFRVSTIVMSFFILISHQKKKRDRQLLIWISDFSFFCFWFCIRSCFTIEFICVLRMFYTESIGSSKQCPFIMITIFHIKCHFYGSSWSYKKIVRLHNITIADRNANCK